jgi:hypothetical protein
MALVSVAAEAVEFFQKLFREEKALAHAETSDTFAC